MFKPLFIYFLLSSLTIFSMFYILLAYKLKLPFLMAYLIAINLSVFILYAYDKISAKLSFLRVPESILHLFTLFGATPLAYFSQKVFTHKTTKPQFQSTFKKIVILQVLLIIAFIVTIAFIF